jgi:RNA ligase (TIGR02306 family)
MRTLASIEQILAVEPIEGADAIEKVQVKGWWVVVKKDDHFQVGQPCVYFEIDSVLPETNPIFEFMAARHFRIRTIKLRGQISQGLVMPVSILPTIPEMRGVGDDVTEEMGVTLWVPNIPANLSGTVKGNFPSFLHKTDEERVQNLSRVIEDAQGAELYLTEKIDGTSFTCYLWDNQFGVCSRNLELKETEENLYWKIARRDLLEEKLRDLHIVHAKNFCIQGEIVGPGIQGNKYKLDELQLRVFNLYDINTGAYLDYEDFRELCDRQALNIVPLIDDKFILNHSVQELVEMADGKSLLNPLVLREGIVFRGIQNRPIRGLSRFSFKAISNKFLLKFEE